MFRRIKNLLAACIVFVGSFYYVNVYAQNVKTTIPANAHKYMPILLSEIDRLDPDNKWPHYYGALIEHESCISLTSKKCWDPTSRLKTDVEEGAGLPQLTRTWNKNGTVRFDTLTSLAKSYSDELRELSWDNVYTRPDLQIRAMILLSLENYKKLYMIEDPWQRLAMSDAAYNGGLSDLKKERMKCGLAAGCDPNIWFDHVENHCVKSTTVYIGGRNRCQINRHHTRDVLYTRMPKYEKAFYELRQRSLEESLGLKVSSTDTSKEPAEGLKLPTGPSTAVSNTTSTTTDTKAPEASNEHPTNKSTLWEKIKSFFT
jgi:hypothetical protein